MLRLTGVDCVNISFYLPVSIVTKRQISAMERIQMQIAQYRKELNTPRIKMSESSVEIVRFCTTEPDPLRDGLPKSQNPFLKQGSTCCTII